MIVQATEWTVGLILEPREASAVLTAIERGPAPEDCSVLRELADHLRAFVGAES